MSEEGTCPYCKRIVIEDVEAYKEKYPDEKYIQCPHCSGQMKL